MPRRDHVMHPQALVDNIMATFANWAKPTVQ
jgi:hypothetical protein